jgi:hypothetical protein
MENDEQKEEMQSAPMAELTISDLQNIRALIESVARRNVFQVNEFSAVGSVYDKLNNFLAAVAKSDSQQG